MDVIEAWGWEWFEAERSDLEQLDGEALAERFAAKVSEFDARLGVEVGVGDEGREIVVTSHGDAELFGVVEQFVSNAPSISGWRFIALKPPRGFEFELDAESFQIDAETLRFEPVIPDADPGELGIRLFVPDVDEEIWSNLAWLVVETGVGEKAASRIDHIELAPVEAAPPGARPITGLFEYLAGRSPALA